MEKLHILAIVDKTGNDAKDEKDKFGLPAASANHCAKKSCLMG